MNLHALEGRAVFAGTRRAAARRRLGLGPACFVVLCSVLAGTPCAGIDTVILGVARLRQRHGVDGLLLVALGIAADAELARLRELTRALGMRAHVRFVIAAPMNALRDCHAAADVLVNTPWGSASISSAPLSSAPRRTAHAAASSPRPVIGSDAGQLRAATLDGATGYLIPPRDPETLAARLAHLANLAVPAETAFQ
ncbi:glycosyltransferase [Massilia aurea]|uniref:glycosyltransferase n=1 Tax=Massilia aurea TaxID=373040 RepID=UPI0034625D6F